MIFNSARTIYNVKLQTCKLLNMDYRPLVSTTLNEKLNIYPNYEFSENMMPDVNLLIFGVGGNNIVNSDVLSLKRAKHGALDGALFDMIPLLIKSYGEELSELEQSLYRLKTTESIDGVGYDIYYGMVLRTIDYDPRVYQITSTEVSLNSKIIDTATAVEILSPTPKAALLNDNSGKEYVVNTCKIGITLNSMLLQNMNDALAIKYPDKIPTTITEIGICSSLDTSIDDKYEALWTQVNYFIDLSLDVQLLESRIDINGAVTLNIDIGGMEPLIV